MSQQRHIEGINRSWNPATGCLEVSLASNQSGEANPNWRGGRTKTSHGYILVRMPHHHLADCRGYVYEHRLVAEQMLGRPLKQGEEVHHKDGNKQNNDPSNLEINPSRRHHQVHHRKTNFNLRNPEEPNTQISCACGCGSQLEKYDKAGRPRRFISGHNLEKRSKSHVS